jgi:hypothetical protein
MVEKLTLNRNNCVKPSIFTAEEFNVHKYILIANSEVFRAMFSHKNTTEFREGEGRITIKDSTIAAVRHMVHYMYTGKISDDYDREEDALPLLTIAHKYQIKPLIYFNEQILVERFAHSHNGRDSLRMKKLL